MIFPDKNNAPSLFSSADNSENSFEKRGNGQIIACIDGSSASKDTLNFACNLTKTNNWELVVIAVNEASHRNFLFGASELGHQKRETLKKQIFRLIKEICEPQEIQPKVSIREGEIFAEIAAEIKSHQNCKMLVFGKSKHSQSDNNLLPKLITKLSDKIQLPTLIIPEGYTKAT